MSCPSSSLPSWFRNLQNSTVPWTGQLLSGVVWSSLPVVETPWLNLNTKITHSALSECCSSTCDVFRTEWLTCPPHLDGLCWTCRLPALYLWGAQMFSLSSHKGHWQQGWPQGNVLLSELGVGNAGSSQALQRNLSSHLCPWRSTETTTRVHRGLGSYGHTLAFPNHHLPHSTFAGRASRITRLKM